MLLWKKSLIRQFLTLSGIFFFLSGCGMSLSIQSLSPVPQQQQDEKLSSDEYWDLLDETICSPKEPNVSTKRFAVWFNNEIANNGFSYVYGGKTVAKIQKGTTKNYSGILACYFDNDDYSGVTVVLGDNKTINIESIRNEKPSGIAFWAKGDIGNESIYVGLVDDESDGMKVQTKIALRDFGKVDTTWHYFMVPLKKFQVKGRYWDAVKKAEIVKDVNWKAISEVRFSVNKGENKVKSGKPVKFYVEDISFIEEIPGYFDTEKYWQSFTSNEPDILLHDLETGSDQVWETGSGPASNVKIEIVKSMDKKYGEKSLAVTYSLSDWCDIMYDYPKNNITDKRVNWSKHWGLKFDLYSTRPYQSINVQISDAGNELYIASCGGPQGWSEIIVPFKDFYKFPYYQPADAKHNGIFDLENVQKIDIKPAGEGLSSTFLIDNIRLTNSRTVQEIVAPAEKEVVITGNFNSKIVEKIQSGIFGINAQFWDGDLLSPKTSEFVKEINHKVIRFPGGLSADEYHWKEALGKDGIVDIDEFMNFCKKTNCEPMITVNFGTGTPEEAAAWVRYLNIEKKHNVRLWEVGNELYGEWHKNHCSAEDYGKRTAEFIKAMKSIDPSILITVVWDLEGKWNKTVFDYTKDLADGVNIHNYPQGSGQENDIGLLASPQILDQIIPSVKRQLNDYGQKNKNYQIWLTEWNSVDFNPGPQSLSMVNALFVADYLGMLAKQNIDQASYWTIHNGMFEQGGDYGYLSRNDIVEGANVPRPSYWAFKLANQSLRGSLVECSSNDKNVSVYANIHKDGKKSVLIINKYPKTRANVLMQIPELVGSGMCTQLLNETASKGFTSKPIVLKKEMSLQLAPHSITQFELK